MSELQLQLASNLLHNFWLGCGSYSRHTNPYIDRRPDALVEDTQCDTQLETRKTPNATLNATLNSRPGRHPMRHSMRHSTRDPEDTQCDTQCDTQLETRKMVNPWTEGVKSPRKSGIQFIGSEALVKGPAKGMTCTRR